MALRRSVVIALGAMVIFAACSPGTIDLRYRYPAGTVWHYKVHMVQTTQTESAEEQTSTTEVIEADLYERVLRRTARGVTQVELELIPNQAKLDGRVGPTPPPAKTVSATDAIVGSAAVEGSLIGHRPPLPRAPVRVESRWRLDSAFKSGGDDISLSTAAVLDRFVLSGHRNLAEVLTSRTGTIGSTRTVTDGTAALQGRIRARTTSTIDVRTGELVTNNTTSVTIFDIELKGSDRKGILRISSTSRLRLVEDQAR